MDKLTLYKENSSTLRFNNLKFLKVKLTKGNLTREK